MKSMDVVFFQEVLFRESPMSGLLYSSFKSMLFSQDIPPEEMERPGCRTKRSPLTSVENLELMTNDNYIETGMLDTQI